MINNRKLIKQAEFNKLARLTRQEHRGTKYRLTLVERSGQQYIEVHYRKLCIMVKILCVVDRLLFYTIRIKDESTIICKAIFGINFCKIICDAKMPTYSYGRCNAFDVFVDKYKFVFKSNYPIIGECHTTDNNTEIESKYEIVHCGLYGKIFKVDLKDYREGYPVYNECRYTVRHVIVTPMIPWITAHNIFVYDYGQSFYISTDPFFTSYMKIHKENPAKFVYMIGIHLRAILTMDTEKSYDTFIVTRHKAVTNAPYNAFNFDLGQSRYFDIIVLHNNDQ